MKCVIVIANTIPTGLIANTAAALGISLSGYIEGLTGKEIKDKDGRTHKGITNIPVPILTADQHSVKSIYDSLIEQSDPELTVIGFNDVAQVSNHYDDYEVKLNNTYAEEITYLGICLYGTKKKVNKITGSLKMLK